jgi:hypothetical protein
MPTNELAGRGRFVFEIVLNWGEGLAAELVDGDWVGNVLEAMLAEVCELEAYEHVTRRLAHDDLTAVPRGGDAGGEVHLLADVALAAETRLAVCKPTRTRIGPAASARVISEAAVRAPGAVGTAKKKASPYVSTSTPPVCCAGPRIRRRCSVSASS